MNRILRPILSMRGLRMCIIVLLCAASVSSFGQLSNCPNPITNIVIQDPMTACVDTFSLDSYPTWDNEEEEVEVRWFSTGATTNGIMPQSDADFVSSTLPITAFTTVPFNFGLSTVVFVAPDGAGGFETCSTIAFVSEEANLPTDACDPITVDLGGECTAEVATPYDLTIINTDTCDPSAVDSVTYSWSMVSTDPPQRTIVVDAHNGNPSFYSLYLRKYRDDVLIRQAPCLIQVTAENSLVPDLVCPSSETITIPTGCTAPYAYDVEGATTIPCDGSLVQLAGDPSGTPLSDGAYTYTFEIYDQNSATVESCTWIVTVDESDLAPTQLSCLGDLNVSIDQNCEATIDINTILTGSVCIEPTLLEMFAVIPGQGEVVGPSLTFTDLNVGQSIDVTVRDVNGLNSCWGTVHIEDKVGPAITCPADMTISCTMPTDTMANGVPTLVGTGCTDVTISFTDAVLDNQCRGDYQSIITRRFIAEDGAGNFGDPCIQTIFITRESLLSATLPPHWDGIDVHTGIQDNGVGANDPLACDGAGVVYNTITREDGRVVPSPYADGDLIGTGAPGDVGVCGTIFSFYEDLIIDICEEDCSQYNPSYKVLRTWEVFDWCTGGVLLHQQIIKVVDSVAPVFTTGVPDLIVSTDLWGCGATIYLPTVEAEDNCSSDVTYSWGVTGGTYDPVSNTVYVADDARTFPGEEVMLFAYAEDCCGNIVADTGLVTIVDNVPPSVVADEHTVISLNNQSEDGFTKVYAESFDDGSFDGCGPIDFWVRRMDRACAAFDGDEGEIDEINDFHKRIHFCCEDLEEEQMVVFMVCDDGDRDGVVEMNGDDNCNTAMVLVDVQDKLAPTINCPPDREVDCIEFAAYVDLLDTELSEDDIERLEIRFGTAFSISTCGDIGNQTFMSNMDEVCSVGAVSRSFTVTTTNGQASCVQTIDIVGDEDNLLSCDRIAFMPGTPEANANYDWCDPADEVTPAVTPISITECGAINIIEPLIDRDGLCTEVGINLTLDTFNFAGGACMKILAHWEVIDQCFFEENFLHDNEEIDPFVNENGYYELYVEYDIFDNDPPQLACDDITVETTDCVLNFDSFTMTATDECTADDLVSITYKVDIGGEGVYDFPADGSAAEGNTFDANFVDGLPIGNHAIKWIAYDGCGNYATCTQNIEVVKQGKAPTPYCHLGLSSAVMDEQYGCSVEMWATDFALDSFDDCDENITVTMIPYQDIYGDPADFDDDLSVEDAFNMSQANWTFGCEYIENGVQHVVELRIYFADEDGVYDYCDASLTLNDNFDCCEDLDLGGAAMITGNIATEVGEVLENVTVSIMTNHPEFPLYKGTDVDGAYLFNNLGKGYNYEISAAGAKDAKEGVSTLDLVIIQRHILGLEELDSPYKIIAADVNGNEKISAVDLLQLRKLILGFYEGNQLPDNASWRFVDNAFVFSDVKSPFPFSESIDVENLSYAMYNQNFVGVKIGDVNGSVSAKISGAAVKRSSEKLTLTTDNSSFSAGELVTVSISNADLANIYGLQLGFGFSDALEFVSINSDALELTDQQYSVKDGQIALSWNSIDLQQFNKGGELLEITFKANASGLISSNLSLSEKVLESEAYNENLEVINVELETRSEESQSFQVLQNTPNPFNSETSIEIVLPQEGSVNYKIVDVTGRILVDRTNNFAKGYNVIKIEKSDLDAAGVYYYQILYGKESVSRKMILMD